MPARWCASERKWKGSKGMSGTELEEHECEKGGWAGREGGGRGGGQAGERDKRERIEGQAREN